MTRTEGARMRHLWVIVLAVMMCACGRTAVQEDRSTATPPPPADAASPVTLPSGYGSHHHAIATVSPEAQRVFDQGLSIAFAFNHEEAIRSFERAAELDPRAAMVQWGIAWALGPNYNLDIDDPRARQAFGAVEKAKALAAGGPEHERAYIDALAVRYSPDPTADRAALARKYKDAMGGLMRRYPDDLDAATLYAESLMNLRPWKLWTLDGKPAEGTAEIVAVLESVLRRDPDHIGANHYYIHAVEASRDPGRALPSAARLPTLAPAAGHLVHMPAHVYARTGDHDAAARANIAGAAADREYFKTARSDSFYGMAYFSHNLHFLVDSHSMQGRFEDARQAAAQLAEHLDPHVQMMPMIESMIVAPISVLLRFRRDKDVLELPKPADNRPVMVAYWHFARGVAFARTGNLERAVEERRALTKAVTTVPDSALFGGTGLASAKMILDLAALVLDARIAAARGERQNAIEIWTRAAVVADQVPYDEPPVWFYPVRESLGAALVLAGRYAEAERVFRDDLDRHPRNARSLFGLETALEKQGKDVDALWIRHAFDEAWKNADSKVTVEDL
jgi:tetratricopeptide (TPR) repeat protein